MNIISANWPPSNSWTGHNQKLGQKEVCPIQLTRNIATVLLCYICLVQSIGFCINWPWELHELTRSIDTVQYITAICLSLASHYSQIKWYTAYEESTSVSCFIQNLCRILLICNINVNVLICNPNSIVIMKEWWFCYYSLMCLYRIRSVGRVLHC